MPSFYDSRDTLFQELFPEGSISTFFPQSSSNIPADFAPSYPHDTSKTWNTYPSCHFIKATLSWTVTASNYLNTPKLTTRKSNNYDIESQELSMGPGNKRCVIAHSRRCVHMSNMDMF